MKLILGLLFALTGLLKFVSFPPANDQSININTHTMAQDTIKEPTVELEQTTVKPMNLLVVHDTAATVADIGQVINTGYGELFTFINQHGLMPGKVMAFYYSSQPPFILDAAVETDKIPEGLTGRIKQKQVAGGSAIVAHYKGPYEKVDIAYTAITNWLKQHKKEANGHPFEAYLNDPFSVKDPFELRTDVYQLIK